MKGYKFATMECLAGGCNISGVGGIGDAICEEAHVGIARAGERRDESRPGTDTVILERYKLARRQKGARAYHSGEERGNEGSSDGNGDKKELVSVALDG